MANKYFTYILRCNEGILYTGYTNNLQQRLNKHNQGKGAKFTRGRGPVEIVYVEEFPTRGEAIAREIKIKKMRRPEKLKMIAVMNNDRKSG
jgi:putative endonuclease